MRNNLKLALVEYKVVFQLLPPILTVLATICYNFREDYLINTNAFCIKVYVIYVFLLILLSIAFILFGYSLHYANTELSALKKEYNSLKDASEEQIKKSLELEAECDSLRINFDNFFEEVLSLIFRSLKLGGRERVSVYFIPKDEKIFILLSRFSKNPTLRTKSKNNYSFKEGFIYKAVENGALTENIQADPDDINAYTEEVQIYLTGLLNPYRYGVQSGACSDIGSTLIKILNLGS